MSNASHSSVDVVVVRTRRQWNAFHALPARLRAGDPDWVRPLSLQVRQTWAPRHPYFRHARARAWLALRGGEPVGRISAQVDELQSTAGRPARGEFGQIEAPDDVEVFAALFDRACDWLRAEGKSEVAGPFDLSINQQCGLLVDGFDAPPMMLMNHNPRYYAERIEALGFEPAAELLAYRGSPRYDLDPRIQRALDRLGSRLVTRPLARGELAAHAEVMRALFNAAWAENWGFVPLTADEFRHMVGEMKLLIRPGYVQLAYFDGQPAGFIVALPDINELIADLDGRLLPTGAVRLLWRIARRRNRRARIPLMGIAPAFQQSFRGAAIAYALIEAVRRCLVADGIELTEQSWILEENRGMRAIVEAIGMSVAQRFRIYRRGLSP
jgi:hypothetical protein